MKVRYKILDRDKDHILYHVIVKEKDTATYQLKRSKDENIWANPGEKVLKAEDDGNGIIIGDTKYEYHEAQELYAILKTMLEHDRYIFEPLTVIKNEH